MLYRLGHLFLAATFAAACLLHQAQAAQIRPLERSIVADTKEHHSVKLNRRWWFMWPGSLAPQSPRKDRWKTINAGWMLHNDPAAGAAIQKAIDSAKLDAPTFVQVSVDGRQSKGDAAN